VSALFSELRSSALAPLALLKWLPLILLVGALVVVGGKWLWARRQRKQAEAPAQSGRPRLRLRRTWTAFLRRTPATQRRGLALFQPFIVLGEAGAGKSALIERFVDWRGQSAQFHPSYVEDPLLQIYRGTRSLVQELSATLLQDASPEAHKALAQLWRPLRCGRPPRVVIALSATRLMKMGTDELVRQAQLARGKLDLLAELVRRPVEATIVVTHADQLVGFLELAEVLRDHDKALRVELLPNDEALNLERAFGGFEQYLPLMLSTSTPPGYLKALALFDELAGLTRAIDIFVRTLRSADSIAPAPRVAEVALASSKEKGDAAWSPFAATITADDVRRFKPLRRHALWAEALLLASTLHMTLGYEAARARIDESSRRLDAVLEAPLDGDARADWVEDLAAARRSLGRRLLPGFFASDTTFVHAELRRRFVAGVRERLLLPHLMPEERGKDGAIGLYGLSLLYASNRSELGKFVLAHVAQWADALGLPAPLVRAYVEAAEPALAPTEDARELVQRVSIAWPAGAPNVVRLATALQRRLAQPFITPRELGELKELAAPVRLDADALARRETLAAVAALVKQETGIDLGDPWRRRATSGNPMDAPSVERLAALVERSQLDTPDGKQLDLGGLVAALAEIAALRPPARAPIALDLDGQPLAIDPGAWERLLVRSRAALLVHGFVARGEDALSLLFAHPDAYPALAVSARGDGCSFGGGGRVDGVYTAQALSEHLAPALAQLPDLLTKLSLSDDDKQELTSHIVDAVAEYASDYVEKYRGLLSALHCSARTPVELRTLTSQLPGASSPLRATLRELARNTTLTLPRDNPFAAPLEVIPEEFAALRALAPAAGPAPQLDGWAMLLRTIQAAIDGRAPPLGDKEPEGGLRSKLSPLGRIALSIYRGDDDSPKLQVERWLTTANVDTEWWPPFAAPIEEAYALGRRELQKVLAQSWSDLVQAHVQPLGELFPFRRDAETAATAPLVEAALAPKQAFWSLFEAGIAPVLTTGAREVWRGREGRSSSLLPADLLATVNRWSALSALLWDKDGKPKPLVLRVRPLPLAPVGGDRVNGPSVLASYLQIAGATIYGFNQRADWTTLKVEWWKADSSSVGVTIGGADGAGRSYRAVTVAQTPWSLWRLFQRATSDETRVYQWRVPSPVDGRTLAVQFEVKDDPWTPFLLR
jgi:hypothetical protein